MSSHRSNEPVWVGWLLLAASAVMTVWYAKNQLVFSLLFLYQLLQFGL